MSDPTLLDSELTNPRSHWQASGPRTAVCSLSQPVQPVHMGPEALAVEPAVTRRIELPESLETGSADPIISSAHWQPWPVRRLAPSTSPGAPAGWQGSSCSVPGGLPGRAAWAGLKRPDPGTVTVTAGLADSASRKPSPR